MDPILSLFLTTWEWRPVVLVTLGATGALFFLGWYRLRAHSRGRFATGIRLVSYSTGLVVLGFSLLSAVDVLGGQLFFMHMIQHLLLVMVAPPLLLLANPFPFFLWALPVSVRQRVGTYFAGSSRFRQALRRSTPVGLVWIVYVLVLLGWHDPVAYTLALQVEWVHNVEHIAFFGTAMLFWWHIIGAGPRIHGSHPPALRIALLLLTIPPNAILGSFLAFADTPIYSYYVAVPRIWQISVLDDQRLAGVIMWIPGSMMYIIAVLAILAALLSKEEGKPPLEPGQWATDDAMIAPGWEYRNLQAKWRRIKTPPKVPS